jgi:SAM-dependent methyltransferase
VPRAHSGLVASQSFTSHPSAPPPPMTEATTPQDSNAGSKQVQSAVRPSELVDAFVRVLLEQQPTSYLDIGCGSGALVERLATHAIRTHGIEVTPTPAALATGLVSAADAHDLPFAAGSFDFVGFRHVPHHLPNLELALSEAWRVCRHGLLLAEPWFEPSAPSQVLTAELDGWLKVFERRRGRYHADALSVADLMAVLPDASNCRAEMLAPMHPYLGVELEQHMLEAIGELELTADEEGLRALWLQRANTGELTANGTLILRVGKHSRD